MVLLLCCCLARWNARTDWIILYIYGIWWMRVSVPLHRNTLVTLNQFRRVQSAVAVATRTLTVESSLSVRSLLVSFRKSFPHFSTYIFILSHNSEPQCELNNSLLVSLFGFFVSLLLYFWISEMTCRKLDEAFFRLLWSLSGILFGCLCC